MPSIPSIPSIQHFPKPHLSPLPQPNVCSHIYFSRPAVVALYDVTHTLVRHSQHFGLIVLKVETDSEYSEHAFSNSIENKKGKEVYEKYTKGRILDISVQGTLLQHHKMTRRHNTFLFYDFVFMLM